MARKIDRSLSIDGETSLNSNRANFSLKSLAKNFDGSLFGLQASSKKICADGEDVFGNSAVCVSP
jgi:hypothetical protein